MVADYSLYKAISQHLLHVEAIIMTQSVQKNSQYWLLRLIACLPRPILEALAKLISLISWVSNSRMRQITELNIGYCYPKLSKAEQTRLAKQSILETIRIGLELPQVLFHSANQNLKRIENIQGFEHLDRLLDEGNGVIVLIPHLGNWEYLGLYLGEHYDCVSLFKPGKNPTANALVQNARSKTGAKLMPTDKKGVMAVLKHLKSGGISCILPDQVPSDPASRIQADFMSHSAPTMTLVSNLVKKPKIKAVAGFAKRLNNGNFNLIIQPVNDELYSKDTASSATALNLAVEALVQEAPAQYQWEYKRFKYDNTGKKHPLYKNKLK